MDCSNYSKLLSPYLDNQLEDAQKDLVKKHMEQCSRCAQEYEQLRKIANYCRQLDELDLPSDFHEQLHKQLLLEQKKKNWTKYRIFSGAAAAVIVAFLGVKLIGSGYLPIFNIDDLGMRSTSMAVQEEMAVEDDGAAYESENVEIAVADFAEDEIAKEEPEKSNEANGERKLLTQRAAFAKSGAADSVEQDKEQDAEDAQLLSQTSWEEQRPKLSWLKAAAYFVAAGLGLILLFALFLKRKGKKSGLN